MENINSIQNVINIPEQIYIDDEMFEQIEDYIKNYEKEQYYHYTEEEESNQIDEFVDKISTFPETINLKNLYIQMIIPLLKKNFQGYSSETKKILAIFTACWNKLFLETNKYSSLAEYEWNQILWLYVIGCPCNIKTTYDFVLSVCEILLSVKQKTIQEAIFALENAGFSNTLAIRITDLLYDNSMVYSFEDSLLQMAKPID
jgi:hypothetical protein